MLELLSPAGSMEALRAAVQNGANAVYLGYDMFNARMGAQNFSADELQEAIVYCHVRGVQVHLTLNTLVSDREMARAAEVIRAAAVFGVDAFIVQDLGMVQLCKEIAPSVPEALEKIVMKAMEASLDNRYQTADALAADLEALQKSLTGSLDRIEGNVTPLSTAGELGREDYVRRRRRAHRVSMLSGFFGVMAAILIIAVFLWNYFLSDIFVVNQRVAIPNFVGSNYETIINSKEFKGKYNFDLIYEIDPNVERGIIIGQSPDAGKSYMLTSDGIHVTLTVSTGVMLTEIPNLLNYDYREATSELEKLGFVVDKTFADSDDVAADCVMQISPSPGEKLPAGATVYLTISQGAKTETVIMPYLVGKDYATAEAELAAARLTLVSVSYVYNNTIPVDYVVSQTVEAGTEIPAYSKIYLQISLGPETTPTPSPSPVPTQDPNAE